VHAAKLIDRYERWCDRVLPFDAAARAEKHRRMAASAFAFLRASYPVWLDRFAVDPAHAAAPVPLGVGDLHVENFGTWLARDGEAFGVNDYDETGPVAFTNDLVRLTASAILAAREGHLHLPAADIAAQVWDGYRAGGVPAAGVALGDHSVPDGPAIAAMWRAARPGASRFWHSIDALAEVAPAGDVPAPAPGFVLHARRRRIAGLGSRDHTRLLLDGELAGERAAFERKPIAPAAAAFTAGADPSPDGSAYAALLQRQREHSPGLCAQIRVDGRVVVRRLDPDRGRIEIVDLPHRRDERALLRTMGRCTAAHHRLSADVDGLRDRFGVDALEHAARRMVATVVADHEQFRAHVSADGELRA
jgi:Uncharacterized protein conserved in bacteria (DUF2252)